MRTQSGQSELLQIVQIANRGGCMAVIQGGAVALFTPVLTEVGNGFHHIGFQIRRVHGLAEARAVLRSVKAARRELEEHGHHFLRHSEVRPAVSL